MLRKLEVDIEGGPWLERDATVTALEKRAVRAEEMVRLLQRRLFCIQRELWEWTEALLGEEMMQIVAEREREKKR